MGGARLGVRRLTRDISANGKISSLRRRVFVPCLNDDPNPEGSAQVRLGIDRFHPSEEEYARWTGARFRSFSDAGELQQQGGSCDTRKFRLA
jgi:hypothetical protein